MVKTSRTVAAAAVTIGGISTYQGIVIELRPKESDLKLKRKWKKKWKSVGEMDLNGEWWLKAGRQQPGNCSLKKNGGQYQEIVEI
jgi:hypothetical protein